MLEPLTLEACADARCCPFSRLDIDFAIQEQVDWIGVSFVKSADVINNLKSYINARSARDLGTLPTPPHAACLLTWPPLSPAAPSVRTPLGTMACPRSHHPIEVIAKIESFDSVNHLEEIIKASDGIMVARGDLGAQVPLQDVPALQRDIVSPPYRRHCPRAARPCTQEGAQPALLTRRPPSGVPVSADGQALHHCFASPAVHDRVPDPDPCRGARPPPLGAGAWRVSGE